MSRAKKKCLRRYMHMMHNICGLTGWTKEANIRHYRKRHFEANLSNPNGKGNRVPLI